MARRTGIADLPLHGGRAPRWLFDRMAELAPAILEAIVLERGPAEVLRRLSDPYWFQAFGCVLGFDWHSSGVTTVVCGAVKTGLAGRERDVGLWVAGGKGRASRRTPDELRASGALLGLDGERLAYTSRIAAKVDSAAVQDGFGIYHHTFLHTAAGEWAVVQQGMRDGDGSARRYHWLGETAGDPVEEPHAAVASDGAAARVLNLVARESAGARSAIAGLAREHPDRVVGEAERLIAAAGEPGAGQLDLFAAKPAAADAGEAGPIRLRMPTPHPVDVRRDVDPRQLRKILVKTYERAPAGFEQVLATEGVGARGVRALALLAEVVYGAPASIRDPARFSFSHGGKDGHPFPVDRPTYDHSIGYLREAVARARIGRSDRTDALKRLARWAD